MNEVATYITPFIGHGLPILVSFVQSEKTKFIFFQIEARMLILIKENQEQNKKLLRQEELIRDLQGLSVKCSICVCLQSNW